MAEMVKSLPAEGTDVTPSRRGGTRAEGQPGDVAGRLAPDAKQAASQVAAQAKDVVTTQVTERAGRSAIDILQVARALRQTRRELGDNTVAPYVEKTADQLERFSRFLRDANPRDVVRDVESFARREPLLFLGGAFALGLLGARFLKSSARHGQHQGWSDERERGGRSRTDWTLPSRPVQREERSFLSSQSGSSPSGSSQGGSSQSGSSQSGASQSGSSQSGASQGAYSLGPGGAK